MGAEQNRSPAPVLRTMRPDEVDEIFALIQASFGEGWPGIPIQVPPFDHLQWKLSSPGFIPEQATVIELDGRLVGYWGSLNRDVWTGGKRLPGRFGVDRLVHPDFQGRGLSGLHRDWLLSERPSIRQSVNLGMASSHPRLFGAARRRGGRFFVANKVELLTAPLDLGALTRAAFGRRSLRSLLGLGRTLARVALARRRWPPESHPAPATNIRTVDTFDTRADDLWERVRDTLDFAVVRDRRYLNWRYCDPRAGVYRIRAVERDAELLGWMVTGIDGHDARIVDWLTVPDERVLQVLIEDAIAAARHDGVWSIAVLMPSVHAHRGTFRRYGFFVSRQMGNLGYTPEHSMELPDLARDPEARIHIAFGDEDAV